MREKQPNSHYCFACGFENPFGLNLTFYNTGPKEVTCEYTVPDHFQGYPGVVHGGIVTTILDEVLGRTVIGGDPADTRFMVMAKMTMRFRKNVPTNQPLRIVGRLIKSKTRTATANGKVYGPNGEVLAEAEGMLINVPDEIVDDTDLDLLGWRVYPDT